MLGLTIPSLISRVIILMIAFTVHELSHAYVADRLGDDTPRRDGRLSLNPLVHLDPIGSLLLLVTGFGWAKPVRFNPYAVERRTPAGTMLVSIAGPISNMLLAVLGSIPFQLGVVIAVAPAGRFLPSAGSFLREFVFINVLLFFFNLIPLAPLDGEKVLEYFLPPGGRSALYQLRPYGPLLLLLLLFVAPWLGLDILRILIGWPSLQVFRLLTA